MDKNRITFIEQLADAGLDRIEIYLEYIVKFGVDEPHFSAMLDMLDNL